MANGDDPGMELIPLDFEDFGEQREDQPEGDSNDNHMEAEDEDEQTEEPRGKKLRIDKLIARKEKQQRPREEEEDQGGKRPREGDRDGDAAMNIGDGGVRRLLERRT